MEFAVRSVVFCRELDGWLERHIAGQLIDSATSTAMNYRACGRGRSSREFIAKLGLVVEESDESAGWLELIERTKLASGPELQWLRREANELVAIFAASHRTSRMNFEQRRAQTDGRRRDG